MAPHTILVVEDEELMRSILRRLLEGSGYEVVTADSAAAALAAFGENEISATITDIKMSGMDGLQLLGRCGAQQVAIARHRSLVLGRAGSRRGGARAVCGGAVAARAGVLAVLPRGAAEQLVEKAHGVHPLLARAPCRRARHQSQRCHDPTGFRAHGSGAVR